MAATVDLIAKPSNISKVSLKWFSLSKLPARFLTRLFSLVLGLMILTMANAAMAMLQQGDSGDAVRDLQNRLIAEQCYTGPISGYFGPLTTEGVIACQQKYGLVADGVVGRQTMAALDSVAPSQPNVSQSAAPANSDELQQGSEGEKVIALQRQLKALNLYQGGIDGIFGPMTQAAIVDFQRTNGLVQTGVFGELERQIIATVTPSTTASATTAGMTFGRAQLTLGDAGRDVQRLQERLKELRHFDSAATGYFGDLTKLAVNNFQTASRIPGTGVADAVTLRALGLSPGSQALQTQPAGNGNQEAFNQSGFTNNSGFNNSGFNNSGFTSNSEGTPIRNFGNADDRSDSRFVVIIPKRDGVNLNQVRQLVPEATEGKSSIGSFIQAGAFSNQKAAEQHSRMLQAYKLDARVAYR